MVRVCLFVILASVLSGQSHATEVFTLCQLFQDLDSYDGKRVTIRATFRFGREVSGFYSEACENLVILDGHEIQPHVWASMTPGANADLTQAVGDARTKPIIIVLTASGTLRTHNAQFMRPNGTLGAVRMFGHLGAFPAELRVEKIDKIEISINSDEPSNFDLAKKRP